MGEQFAVGIFALTESRNKNNLDFFLDPVEQALADAVFWTPFEDDRPPMKFRCSGCPSRHVGCPEYASTVVKLAECVRTGVSFGCHMSVDAMGVPTRLCAEYCAARDLTLKDPSHSPIRTIDGPPFDFEEGHNEKDPKA